MIKKFLIACILILPLKNILAAEWQFTPHIYSRGGVTMSGNLSQTNLNHTPFNLGPWNEESNSIRGNLTEITLEAKLGEQFKFFYGIDVQNNNRFFQGGGTNSDSDVNERLAYAEFYHTNGSFWFGSRPYRGTGDYLMQNWVLDEHNMFGGGVRLERLGPFNMEIAYGAETVSDPSVTDTNLAYVRNIFIHKLEYPLNNGLLKSNIEFHKLPSEAENHRNGFMIGGQWQKWGYKLFEGDWYNALTINLAKGDIAGGLMRSVFYDDDSASYQDDKSELAKTILKWNGDLKYTKFGVYYSFQYQMHKGTENGTAGSWAYLDSMIRPVYGLTKNITTGIDLAKRTIITKENLPALANEKGAATRGAIMVAYNLPDETFGMPSVRLFVGKIIKDYTESYFASRTDKEASFVRLDYEVSF